MCFALDGARRGQQLIDDLLAFSRVGTRGRAPQPAHCERVLQTALQDLDLAIRESGSTLSHGPLPTVMGDGAQLSLVLKNLIGNALKFRGRDPPRVHVSAERQGEEWVFAVEDNGLGIAPEYFERIFLIFQRLHTREEYPGTGIGLAIAKRIVERHGGRIWVESEPGRGSTFRFSIPACDDRNGAMS
jgi:light-regulated signal transduction histidine kinase (bacteriophytochrome)